MLGPPSAEELKQYIAEIEEEGAHYVRVPPYRWDYPASTTEITLDDIIR